MRGRQHSKEAEITSLHGACVDVRVTFHFFIDEERTNETPGRGATESQYHTSPLIAVTTMFDHVVINKAFVAYG